MTCVKRIGIDTAQIHPQNPRMIRALITKTIVLAAVLGIATAGWSCGVLGGAGVLGTRSVVASGKGMPGSDNAMKDCQDAGKAQVSSPCVFLCAVTVSVAPQVSRLTAVQVGEARYAASPSFESWLIQPEPYPPRA